MARSLRARSPRCALVVSAVAACAAFIGMSPARATVIEPVHPTPGALDVRVALSDNDFLAFRSTTPTGTGVFGLAPSSPPAQGGVLITVRGEAFGSAMISPPTMTPDGRLLVNDSSVQGGQLLIRPGSNGTVITISGSHFRPVGQPAAAGLGLHRQVSRVERPGQTDGIFGFADDGSIITIFGSGFDQPTPTGSPAGNSFGDVFTRGTDMDGRGGLFARSSGGVLITIAGGAFQSMSDPTAAGEQVLFSAVHGPSGASGIFAAPRVGGSIITIVGDPFGAKRFSQPAMNGAGLIVYGEEGSAGVSVLHAIDVLGASTRIVGVGDTLMGETITSIAYSPEGLNEAGDFAFWASLSDGSSGIFIARGVPAPAGAVVLAGSGLVALRRRRR